MNIGITAQTQYADYRIYAIRRLHALNNGSMSTIDDSVEQTSMGGVETVAGQGAHLKCGGRTRAKPRGGEWRKHQ
jgi:hypothetical protein